MQRLLVASDLSPRSAHAVTRALQLAAQLNAELHVLHVVDADLPATLAEHAKTEAERELQQQVSAGPAGVNAHIEVVRGHPVADVLAAAEAKDAGLVVLGTHRKSPLKDIFVGTTADQLIRLAKRPVLVVRDAPAHPYRKALAAIDLSDHSRRAVEFTTSLLPQLPISLLYVYAMSYTGVASLSQDPADSEKNEQLLRNLMREEERRYLDEVGKLGTEQKVNIRAGQVLSVIPEEVAQQEADLLVIGSQGRGGVARALLGSVASALIRRPPCDTLVVR